MDWNYNLLSPLMISSTYLFTSTIAFTQPYPLLNKDIMSLMTIIRPMDLSISTFVGRLNAEVFLILLGLHK